MTAPSTEKVIAEMRYASELLGDSQVAHDLADWADRLSTPAAGEGDTVEWRELAKTGANLAEQLMERYKDTKAKLTALAAGIEGLERKWRSDVERGTGYLNDESDRAVLSCTDELKALREGK